MTLFRLLDRPRQCLLSRRYGKKRSLDALLQIQKKNVERSGKVKFWTCFLVSPSSMFPFKPPFPQLQSPRLLSHRHFGQQSTRPFWNKLTITRINVDHIGEQSVKEIILTHEKPFPLKRKPIAFFGCDASLETRSPQNQIFKIESLSESSQVDEVIQLISNDFPSRVSSICTTRDLLPAVSLPCELGACKISPKSGFILSQKRKSSTGKGSQSNKKYFWWFDKDSNLIITHYTPKVSRRVIPRQTNKTPVKEPESIDKLNAEESILSAPNTSKSNIVTDLLGTSISHPSEEKTAQLSSGTIKNEVKAQNKEEDNIVRPPMPGRGLPECGKDIGDLGSIERSSFIIQKDLYITSKVIKDTIDGEAPPKRPLKKIPEPLDDSQPKILFVSKDMFSSKKDDSSKLTDCGDIKYGNNLNTPFNIATRKTTAILEESEYRQSIVNKKDKKQDLSVLPKKREPPKDNLRKCESADSQTVTFSDFDLDPIFASLSECIPGNSQNGLEEELAPLNCVIEDSTFLSSSLFNSVDKLSVPPSRAKHESASGITRNQTSSSDHTTKTIILASKSSTKTDIKIIEVEKFVDSRAPTPFTTETFFQIAGANKKIKPFLDVIDATKPKFNIILGKEKKQSNPRIITFSTPTPESPISKPNFHVSTPKCEGILLRKEKNIKDLNPSQTKMVEQTVTPQSTIGNILEKMEKKAEIIKTRPVDENKAPEPPVRKVDEPKPPPPLDSDKSVHDYIQQFSKLFFSNIPKAPSNPVQGTVIDHTKPPQMNSSQIKDNPHLKALKDCTVVKKHFPEVIEVASETEKSFNSWALTVRDHEIINELLEGNPEYSKIKSSPEFKKLKRGIKKRASSTPEHVKEAILSKLKKSARPRKRLKNRSNLLKAGLNQLENSGKKSEKNPPSDKYLPTVADVASKEKKDFNLSLGTLSKEANQSQNAKKDSESVSLQSVSSKNNSVVDLVKSDGPVSLTLPSSPGTDYYELKTTHLSHYTPSDKNEVKCVVPLEEIVNFPLSNPGRSPNPVANDGRIVSIDVTSSTVEQRKFARVPSVSTILNSTLPDSSIFALRHWKEKLILSLGKEGFDEFHKEQLRKGTEFHECMMKMMSGVRLIEEGLHESTKKCLKSVESVLRDIHNPAVIESHVVHPILGYRGIVDCVANYKDKQVIIEWKRSDKPKPILNKTYDAPIQMTAYLGALAFDKNYKLNIKGGLVVVAYSDGSKADAFYLTMEDCDKYWKQWLSRLKGYLESNKQYV